MSSLAFRTLLVLFGAAVTQSLASPTFSLGGRLTLHNTGFASTYYDTVENLKFRMTYDDQYTAAGLQAEYGPLWLFRFRLDLAEARLFTAGGGGLALFPALGLDLICEPPVRWRLKPYLWGGGQLTRYFGEQDTEVLDPRFITGTERHLRAGVGASFTLTPVLDIIGEVQLFSEDTYAFVDAYAHMAGHWVVGSIGFNQLSLGIRYAVTR